MTVRRIYRTVWRQNNSPLFLRPPVTRTCRRWVTSETEMSQITKALTAVANEYVMKLFTQEAIADKLALLGVVP